MLALSPRWMPVCAQNNGSVWQNFFAKKTSLVNYWEFSLNSDGSGAEFGLLVLWQNFAGSVMAFDSSGPSRERLFTWNQSTLSHRKKENWNPPEAQTCFNRGSSLTELLLQIPLQNEHIHVGKHQKIGAPNKDILFMLNAPDKLF